MEWPETGVAGGGKATPWWVMADNVIAAEIFDYRETSWSPEELARLFAAAPKMYRMLENCAPGKGCVDPKCGCKSWAKLKAEIDGETK